MDRDERNLVIFMRVVACLPLLAILPAFMPFHCMQATHALLGLGELRPSSPIFEYLARSCSLLYAMHGAMILFLTFDVRRYLPFVRILALLTLAFALLIVIVDVMADLPLRWLLGEGPFVAVMSLVWLYLISRLKEEKTVSSEQ